MLRSGRTWLSLAIGSGVLWSLTASGCAADPIKSRAHAGEGGTAGAAGKKASSGGTGGSGAVEALGGADTDLGGAPSDQGGGGGTGNETSGGRSTGGTHNGTSGGGSGTTAGGSSSSCEGGLELCGDATECTDLQIGNPDGDGVTDCGTCGTTCSLDHASTASCDAGECQAICESGFGDCNAASANDGCETALDTTANCGSCTHACSLNGASSSACESGHCAPTCGPRYLDCNGDSALASDDGCEVYLDALTACMQADECTATKVACSAANVCNNGTCGAPNGLAVLSVPLPSSTSGGAGHRFADLFPPYANLTGASLRLRVYAPGATGGSVTFFVNDVASHWGPLTTQPLSDFADGWVDVTLSIAIAGSIDATQVKQVNIEVTAGAGPWTDPTVIYVDSIKSTNLVVNDEFDATFGNFVSSSVKTMPGATIGWSAALP